VVCYHAQSDEERFLLTKEVIERFKRVYTPVADGGEGLQPSYAHARDIAQIAQAVRINMGRDRIDLEVIERALEKHVLIALQRMDIDISQVHHSIRTFRIITGDSERAVEVLKLYGALTVALEKGAVLAGSEVWEGPYNANTQNKGRVSLHIP